MPNVSQLSTQDLAAIDQAASAGLSRVATLKSQPLPDARSRLVAIETYLEQFRANPKDGDNHDIEQCVLELGALWGSAVCEQLDWQWFHIQLDKNASSTVVGVAPAHLQLVIYPFFTIYQSLALETSVHIVRAFDILCSPERIPPLPDGGLENVMDHAHPQ